jgi:8-amino-7-oxononanoate synthase
MLDFTSALYLGLRHPSQSLLAWPALTTGMPAVLETPASAISVARQLAALQGCERATLLPSTLHLFWDLFGLLARERVRIYMDAGTYAVAKWGVERAARNVLVCRFPHYDAAAACELIERDERDGCCPIIVADGFCPSCGREAPVSQFLRCLKHHGGKLVLDDTQALGILGERSGTTAPYGLGGGGSLKWRDATSPDVIVGASLAKGLGVPVAVLCGSHPAIRRFEEQSETRVHNSPPSLATLHAAEHALAMNRRYGDRWRLYLSQLVERFCAKLRRIGLSAQGGLFPVQTLDPIDGMPAEILHSRLLRRGIRTVVVRYCRGLGTRLAFLFTALHRPAEIDQVIDALEGVIVSGRAVKLSARVS